MQESLYRETLLFARNRLNPDPHAGPVDGFAPGSGRWQAAGARSSTGSVQTKILTKADQRA